MNTEDKNKQNSNEHKLASPDRASTQPLNSGTQPDANVGMFGHCIQPAHAEDARPDTGAPCADGRDGK